VKIGLVGLGRMGASMARRLMRGGHGCVVHDVDADRIAGLEKDGALGAKAVAEVWRHGSVIRSWLLDLTAQALARDPELGDFEGRVGDSGEGRWSVQAAIEEAVSTPALAGALFNRFRSRRDETFANRVLSAMRHAFGGHQEPAAGPS
jgi:6-phosphogluconate dehydrogenase (decarboxylating)